MRPLYPRGWIALIIGGLVELACLDKLYGQAPDSGTIRPVGAEQLPPLQTVPQPPVDYGPRWSEGLFGRGGFLGLGIFSATGAPSAPGTPDEVWDNATARQDQYHQKLDPPFDEGLLPFHVFLNAGVDYLKPHLDKNTAYRFAQIQTVGGVTELHSNVTSFNYDGEFTPRLTLGGYLDSGWGLRSTWWHFAESSNPLSAFNLDTTSHTLIQPIPAPGVPGFSTPGPVAAAFHVFHDTLLFGSHLETHVWDTEITRKVDLGDWDLLLSAGGRYTYLSQGYLAFRSNQGTGSSGTSRVVITQDSDRVTTGHNLNGFGPTAALEVRRSLGDSGFSLYGIGRTSVLFGRGTTRSQQISIANYQIIPRQGKTQTVNTTRQLSANQGHDDDLPIEEFEVGIAWQHGWGRVTFQSQTGLVYQEWLDAGNAGSTGGDLNFFGFRLTAGLTY